MILKRGWIRLNSDFAIDWLCHLLFGFLAILSVYYYKERMLPFDNAFYVFKLIHFENFNIENGRWGAVPSQILPLIALKLNAGLKLIMQLYSLNILLFHYVCYLIIRYFIKDKWFAVILCLSLVLLYRYTFYYSASEVHFGFGVTSIIGALVFKNINNYTIKMKTVWFILILVSIVYLMFTHLLFVFYIPLYYLLSWILIKENRKQKLFYTSFVIALLLPTVKILSIKSDSYDASKIPSLDVFTSQLPNIFSLPSYLFIKEFYNTYYYPLIPLIIALSVIGLLFKRKILTLLSCVLFFIGFSTLILITYYRGESPVVQENYWILLGIVIAFAFTEGILKNIKPIFVSAFLVLVFSYSSYKIWKGHFLYTQRNEYFERVNAEIRKHGTRKGMVSDRTIDWGKIISRWDIAFESLLLSSIDSPDSATTFFLASSMNEYDSLISSPDLFVSVDFAPLWFWNKDLNKKYFNLKPTLYKKLNSPQSNVDFGYFSPDSVLLDVPERIEKTKYLTATIPVKITNKSNRLINSIGDSNFPTYLSYHLLDEKGNVIIADGKRSYFETDIWPYSTSTTGLLVDLPDRRGKYKLKIDIITEMKRWWYIDKEMELIIK
jgi:hypothetical protein